MSMDRRSTVVIPNQFKHLTRNQHVTKSMENIHHISIYTKIQKKITESDKI